MKHFTLALSIAAAALVAIPATTFAADQPAGDKPSRPEGAAHSGRHMDPEARLKMLTEKLGLDADQQAKIKAIYEKNAPKFKEFMAKGRENITDADKTAMRELFKSQAEEVAAILTPEQKEKFKELHPKRRGEGKPAATK
jgi:Spy/CpxP family protein refolding chaperone